MSTKFSKFIYFSMIYIEGAEFSMMGFHHIGPDGSKPMDRQQLSPGPRVILGSCCARRVSKEIRNLAQRAFQKIRASTENPLYKEMFCPSRLGLLERNSYKEKTSTSRRRGQPPTIKAPIPSQIKVHMIYPLQHSRVENNSNLTFGGYLADTTPVPSVRSLLSSYRLLV